MNEMQKNLRRLMKQKGRASKKNENYTRDDIVVLSAIQRWCKENNIDPWDIIDDGENRISRATLHNIASGKHTPTPETLKKLAVVLEVEPEELGAPTHVSESIRLERYDELLERLG